MSLFSCTRWLAKPAVHALWSGGTVPAAGMRVRHYKGGEFTVVCLATHTEHSPHRLVVYRDAASRVWARPEAMFCGSVSVPGGERVARFVPVGCD